MAKCASTREIIEKLQAYERLNGVGAVVGIATHCAGDRENEYGFIIANDSDYNRVFFNDDNTYKETRIEISSVRDDEIFPRKGIVGIDMQRGRVNTYKC